MNRNGHPVVGFALPEAPIDIRRESITVGDLFRIHLPGGEGWTLIPGDPRVLDVIEATSDGGFTFLAKGPGTTRIVFAYHHPYENRAPIKTVIIDIDVSRVSRWWTWLGIGTVVGIGGGLAYHQRDKLTAITSRVARFARPLTRRFTRRSP